uniref:Uncharacterized protein n=2 Tax=Parascaris univalens TaxID=6257 RepID=A0A915A3V9_PARUN
TPMRPICAAALLLCSLVVDVTPERDYEDEPRMRTHFCYVSFEEIYVTESVSDPTVKCVFNEKRDAKEEEIFKLCNSINLNGHLTDGIIHLHQKVSTRVRANVGVCSH